MSLLTYFASHTKKMASIYHRRENSFNVIDFVKVIQPKLYKCFHHFYLNCFTTNILNYNTCSPWALMIIYSAHVPKKLAHDKCFLRTRKHI